jgi:protein-S-isoprenylcysteine O-methyltransferase Ste14
MEQRRFSENRRILNRKNSRITQIVSQIMLLLGAFILIFGLIFMMINLSKSDSIIMIWIPFIITGIALVMMSLLIKPKKENPKDLHSHTHKHS